MASPGGSLDRDAITIGEALEVSALTAGNKPIEQSDAAAIQAAEMRATGPNEIAPGGVAAVAQYAASVNPRDVNKTKLDATEKLPADKPVTREDAKAVIGAEIRNSPNMATTPGGVVESLAAAAGLNQNGG
ncbi:late embryogenesis abundant protein D-34-like [Malus sylvestris]|uniref:late embryogenesis abundant protein D-34-like n=1 Tax=Malus sylvestris TaxID=3752 RepID=UPI0021ABC578|nr:late embryogenesis abundant protein D-34-like [Malus sylvestris]